MLVSIVVPAHNEQGSLLRCLESLAALDWPIDQYEVVIVDDGSSDGTTAVAATWCATRPNARCLTKPQGGRASALNEGLAVAVGDVVAITDADCEVPADWLNRVCSALEGHHAFVGGYNVRGPRGRNWVVRIQEAEYVAKFNYLGIRGKPSVGANMAVLRDVAVSLGGFAVGRRGVAAEFFSRLETVGYSVVNDPLIQVTTEPELTLWRYVRQKLRWRDSILSAVAHPTLVSTRQWAEFAYSHGLSVLMVVSLVAIMSGNTHGGLVLAFLTPPVVDMALHATTWLRMVSGGCWRQIPFSMLYVAVLQMVRLLLIPYLVWRALRSLGCRLRMAI